MNKRNLNDIMYDIIKTRDNADKWLASKKIKLLNPLSWVWWVIWFYRVRHIHFALNHFRMVKLMEQYYSTVYDIITIEEKAKKDQQRAKQKKAFEY